MSRLCVHTITTKPLSLEQCLAEFPKRGVSGITIWRQALEGRDLNAVKRQTADSGMEVISLCRGGFFPAKSAVDRQKAIDDNLLAIEQAQAIGAPLIVLVCGAVPGQSLIESRKQITDGIAACLPAAEAAGVKLAIEPLHPMYADDRSAVNKSAAQKKEESIREALEHKPHMRLLKRMANALLNLFRLGDSMKAYYIKPSGEPGKP